SKGILQSIDMDSYRVEAKTAMNVALADQVGEVGPVPTSGGGHIPEPELDRLSNIVRFFNEQFGNIQWQDADKIRKVISEEIPAKVAANKAYRNAMKHSDKQNARIEHDRALQKVVLSLLQDHTELFKQFQDVIRDLRIRAGLLLVPIFACATTLSALMRARRAEAGS